MAGSRVNTYSIGQSSLENVMLTLDKAFYAKSDACVITHMNDSTIPAIPLNAVSEVCGALYTFPSEEAISTVDPHTGSTVADGNVYIMLVPSGSNITVCFTATAPVWNDIKQGYYGTLTYANCKYIGGAIKASSLYTGKFVYRGLEKTPKKYESKYAELLNQSMSYNSTAEYTFTLTYSCNIDAIISMMPTAVNSAPYTQGVGSVSCSISSLVISANVITVKVIVARWAGSGEGTQAVDVSVFASVVGV